jgi:hypothetical protein
MARGLNFHVSNGNDILEYDGTIKVHNTAGSGMTASFYNTSATASDTVLYVEKSNGGLSSGKKVLHVYGSSALAGKTLAEFQNASTGVAVFINQDAAGISLDIDTETANDGTIINIDNAGTGGTNCFQVLRNDDMVSGAACIKLNGSYLWVDSLGKLRISAWYPTFDTSGAIVGTQA